MDRLKQLILNRYPDINISYFNDVAGKCKNIKQQLRLIETLRSNTNRIVVIERTGYIHFNKLASEMFGNKINGESLNDYRFILLRGNNQAISVNWLKELQHIVKHILYMHDKLECNICYICYNALGDDDSNSTQCYHCKNIMCLGCAQQLFDTTPYWCPYCCNHLVFPEISKPSGECSAELDYCLQIMMAHAIPNGKVQPRVYIASLPVCNIKRLCSLGASRNHNFEEMFLERTAIDTQELLMPMLK